MSHEERARRLEALTQLRQLFEPLQPDGGW
jgi:hypothetical protein